MSSLDEDKYLSQLTIPGTHESSTFNTKLCTVTKFCQCQNLSIAQQLKAGVRYLDTRLVNKQDKFSINHGPIEMDVNFDDVLSNIQSFLHDSPSETIIMRYRKEQDDKDSSRDFSATLQDYIDSNSDLFYTGDTIPQLKDVRGKVILLNTGGSSQCDGSQGLCKGSAWSDKTSADSWAPDCNPGDSSCDDYIESLKDNMKAAEVASFNSPDQQQFYFTYTSANNGHKLAGPMQFATKVNPAIEEFVKSYDDPVSLGCVVMDFMTSDLSETIYQSNDAHSDRSKFHVKTMNTFLILTSYILQKQRQT